jgi:hypothetical protein
VLRWRFKLFVILTGVHATVALGLMMYAMGVGMARFDSPASDRKVAEIAASSVAHVLMAPGYFIWTAWASKNLPNILERLLFIANSALWAAVGVAIITRTRRSVRVRSERASDSN